MPSFVTFAVAADEAPAVQRDLRRRLAYRVAPDGFVCVWDYVARLERDAALEALRFATGHLPPALADQARDIYRRKLGR